MLFPYFSRTVSASPTLYSRAQPLFDLNYRFHAAPPALLVIVIKMGLEHDEQPVFRQPSDVYSRDADC